MTIPENSPLYNLTDSDFNNLERQYHIRLPYLLEQYYRCCNGQPVEECFFTVNGRVFSVCRIFPLFFGNMSADWLLEIFQGAPAVLPGYFPLAMSCTEEDYFLDTVTGEIFLMDPAIPASKELVCSSVDAFFALLYQNSPAFRAQTAALWQSISQDNPGQSKN